MPARLVVLISGSGSNLQAILEAQASGELSGQVVAVYSNKSDAYGLVRAEMFGVPSIVFPIRAGEFREEYDARLAEDVGRQNPDYVILAGWMRLLSSVFLKQFPGKVINLHPALPGFFAGTHSIQRAYEAWTRAEIDHSGVMVHLVLDEGVDNGPVLATQKIYFQPGESMQEFETRVHTIEHTLLVQTIKYVIQGIV